MPSSVLYEDRFITVSEDTLTIKSYYFPHCAPKTIANTTVDRIWQGTDQCLGLNFFNKKSWGIAFSNVWWAPSLFREFNDDMYNFVVASNDGSKFRHGFSVERPAAARVALNTFAPARTQ